MKLEEFIELKGYKLGTYGSVRHGCGLPHGIQIKPNYSPIDGDHTLVVTGEKVMSCVCSYPWMHNNWRIRSSNSYSSPEELEKIIKEMANPPKGCWD
jgi:hypothetical protein